MAALIVNPRKRGRKRVAAKRRSPVRRRRNPAKRQGVVEKQIMPALIGGAGAVA